MFAVDLVMSRVLASGRPKKARTEDDINKDSEDDLKMEQSATSLASELAEKIEAIETDPDIPVRAKKSQGQKCMYTIRDDSVAWLLMSHDVYALLAGFLAKKDMREIEYEVVKNRLKNLAIDSKLTSGKWMLFPSTESVDAVWSKIAKAIIHEDGALRGKIYTAKVSTYQPGDGEVLWNT